MSSVLKKAVQAASLGSIGAGEAGWTKKVFCFDAGFLGFKGHFPGYPILPAFVQVLTAIVSIEEMMGTGLDLAELDNAKFQREVHPGSTLTVEWQPLEKAPLLFRVRLKSVEETVASFVIRCEEKRGYVS